MPDPALGPLLRHARTEQGIGLRVLAGLVGISPTYLSRIETGHEGSPSDRVLRLLADFLGIDRDAIYVAAGRIPPDILEIVSDPAWWDALRLEVRAGTKPDDLGRRRCLEQMLAASGEHEDAYRWAIAAVARDHVGGTP